MRHHKLLLHFSLCVLWDYNKGQTQSSAPTFFSLYSVVQKKGTARPRQGGTDWRALTLIFHMVKAKGRTAVRPYDLVFLSDR